MKNITIEIKWAVIFAVTALAWMVLEKSLGWHDVHIDQHATLTNIFAVPAIVIYVLALLDKKKNYYKGEMTYLQGFLSGVIISVIVAVLSPFTQYITLTYITPQYFENIIEYSVTTGELTREQAEDWFNMQSYIVQSVIGALIMGVITSAIVAIFVKSKKQS
ncbi:DUF4199 domain-containing protein [Algoriphagus machipongonensis]|uniref:DUF4199 domain-containing protein n=1 Tax=Algoriphagus machipongonensis TaxID=388413 RepID=A3I259_9BACT|nr:DUF4199 domain-containing protein [Algoriphagus machipongonensis]EAZ79463.1 hypothetical protein ALPR1_04453 [Algoriphagus machipongonensis]